MALPLLKAALSPLAKRGPYESAALPGAEVTREVVPDPARLRAYARVCGFEDDGTLPAPYPHVLAFPLAMRLMTARDFPFPVPGLVHTRIALTRHAPLAAADRLTLAVRADGTAPHARGTEFGLVTRALLDGEEVWHSRSTYLFRHERAAPGTREDREERAALPARATWELPAGLGRRYAAASGDRNPIHLHPLTARLFGFPRALAHGMWTFARCLAEAPADLRTAEAVFRSPLLLPARVTYGQEEGRFEVRGGRRGVSSFASPPARQSVPSVVDCDPAAARASLTDSRLHVSGKWGGKASTARPSSGSPGPPSRSS
ncbi:MaoC/PaaZ C-terminal domain-containing protein [Streptomyces albiaxialis]|uniref:MaoC/PaaZ C-terminal domain-containing protein n=1 Tax=Streptomyces albiaxialis TaxID=329523 RepID=A0ABN2VYB4_9ACTN